MADYYTLEQLIYKFFEGKLGSISTLPGVELTSVALVNHEDLNYLVKQSSFVVNIRSSKKAISVEEFAQVLDSVPELNNVRSIMRISIGGTSVNRIGAPPQWEYAIQLDVRYRRESSWHLPES